MDVSVVVGAAGVVTQVSLAMVPVHFVETKLAPPVAVQTPTFNETGVPLQFEPG
jgi:hypothetical protein